MLPISPAAHFGESGTECYYIAAADVNNDGNTDLLYTFSSYGTKVFPGLGDGAFPTELDYSDIVFSEVTDVNHDGCVDLVFLNDIYFGRCDGTFRNAVTVPFTAVWLQSSTYRDVNRDNIVDLVVLDEQDFGYWQFEIRIGNGDGTFQESILVPLEQQPSAYTFADLNEDGALDLCIEYPGGEVDTLLGNGDGTFQSPKKYFLEATSLEEGAVLDSADFDGDGHIDLAGAAWILPGNGDGTFRLPLQLQLLYGPLTGPGDYNGDGRLDLIAGTSAGGPVSQVLLNIPLDLAVAAGSNNQNAQAGTGYPQPLTVTASRQGQEVNGVSIHLTVPASGPSARLVKSGDQLNAMLFTQNGEVSMPAIANDETGGFAVTAETGTSSVLISLTNTTNPCTYSLSVPSAVDSRYTAFTAQITASASQCAWNLLSDADWMTLSASGTGSQTPQLIAYQNTTGVERTATLKLTGVPGVSFTQRATGQIFNDVPPEDYYFDAVNLMWSDQITSGCGPQLYCPADTITRAQTAIFLVRSIMGGDDFTYPTTPYFNDVGPSDFGFKWIQKLAELQITNGCAPQLFCPDNPTPRDQMAVFIIRSRLGATADFDYPSTPYFTDVPPDYWAFKYIQRLAWEHITNGCAPQLFCPSQNVIRGDMAVFVMRGLFNELLPAGTPVLTSIQPNYLIHGQTKSFGIVGVNTHFVEGQSTVLPIAGVTVGEITNTTPGSIQVNLTAPVDAVPGPRTIVIKTGEEEAVLPNGLMVE